MDIVSFIIGRNSVKEGHSVEDIATEAEMNALLVATNIGNAYRYTGTTTENYINGDIYIVEDNT